MHLYFGMLQSKDRFLRWCLYVQEVLQETFYAIGDDGGYVSTALIFIFIFITCF